MKKIYRIYRYTNILNGMKYDGCTSCKYQSIRSGPNGRNYIKMCRRFGEAILEFGWDNFKYEVLEDGLTKEQALEREKYWIEQDDCIWPKGYNLEAGSKNGHSVNDETKKRMSEKRKGKSYVCKPVSQYTKDGLFKAEYSSATEASRKTGLNQGGITKCCRNYYGRKSYGGFVWKYS